MPCGCGMPVMTRTCFPWASSSWMALSPRVLTKTCPSRPTTTSSGVDRVAKRRRVGSSTHNAPPSSAMKTRSDASTAAPTGRTLPLAILVAVLPSPLTRHSTPFGLSGMRMSPFDNSGPMPSIPAPPLAFGNARQTLTACDWKSIAIRTTRLRPCSATRRGPDPYCRPCCTIPSGSLRPAARRSTDPSELRVEPVLTGGQHRHGDQRQPPVMAFDPDEVPVYDGLVLKVISAPELARNVDPILQALEESGTTLIIKHHDQPAALLVRFDAYVAMLATMDYSGWERWIEEVRTAFPTTVFSPPRRPKSIVPAFIDPADLGYAPQFGQVGTSAGRRRLAEELSSMGIQLDEEQLGSVYPLVLSLAERKRALYAEDLKLEIGR